MFDAVESLVLDLLEWVANGERTYDEVMDAWRTSCPRFPVWEDANDRKLITRQHVNGRTIVKVTPSGTALLDQRAGNLRARQYPPPVRAFAVVSRCFSRYERSMKSNTARKSSFTLPAAEHAQVLRLRRLLKASSNTEVIRRSLKLLEESVSREELRRQFREASTRVRASALEAVRDLDPLAGDGLEDV